MKNTIGSRIKMLRESLGFSSQNKFAKEVGVLQATLSNYEADKNKPHQDFYDILSKKYPNINLNWLQFGEGEIWNNGNSPANFVMKDEKNEDGIVEFLKQQLREKDKIIQHLMNSTSKPTLQGGL